jgi:hypothetical protein
MFYYIVHVPLIHALAVIVSEVRTATIDPAVFAYSRPWAPSDARL